MKLKIILIAVIVSLVGNIASAEFNLAQKLSGRILLQVQSAGEAWYIYPADERRYYLGRPADALAVMRRLGLGISETDFDKMSADKNLTARLKGKIILRVQSAGQAYYVNPLNGEKYFLGRPADALAVMKKLALGITNVDLAQIPLEQLGLSETTSPVASPSASPLPTSSQQSVLAQAADAIRGNNATNAKTFFTANLHKAVEYTLPSLSASSRLLLANILSGASLSNQSETEKTYSTSAYFSLGGYEVPLHFYVKKQPDGAWLMTNL